jgi:hypothetical protein
MNKYFFLQIEIKCGEYEFISSDVHEIIEEESIIVFSENYAKEFYSGDMDEDDRTYYFNRGEVAVEVLKREIISKEEYTIMRKYL